MNNKFSDVDKVIITTWLFFGAGVGVFVGTIFHTNFFITGAIGLFAGTLVDYVLFFEPRRGKNTPLTSIDQQINPADEETDILEFIRDSFEAEDIISQDEIEFRYEDNIAEENSDGIELMDDPETILGETEDNTIDEDTSEKIQLEEENLNEDHLEDEITLPASSGYGNQIHSYSYDQYEGDKPRGTQPWLSPTQFPMVLAFLWFFISQLILNNAEFTKFISLYFPAFLFVVIPIFFLIGSSGLIGILSGKPNETLEMSSKENAAYLINFLKLFAGWGIGIYAILVNL